jgi:hypothetical protein
LNSSRAPSQEDFPALHVAAEATSKSAQDLFKRLTSIRLGLLVAAAGLGVWAAMGDAARWLGGGAALLFLLTLLLELYLLKQGPERTWYQARAAAESAKTLGWRYAVGGEPFGKNLNGGAEALLHKQLEAVLGVLKDLDLAAEIGSGKAVTEWMATLRASSLRERQVAYEAHRVVDQQNWYTRRGKDHKKRLDWWTAALFASEAVGLFGAVLRIAGVVRLDLLGVAAATAAAVAAWIQTNQYRALNSAYVVTALELSSLRDKVLTPMSEEEWAQFVEEAEKAFSREHTLWKASRGVQSL